MGMTFQEFSIRIQLLSRYVSQCRIKFSKVFYIRVKALIWIWIFLNEKLCYLDNTIFLLLLTSSHCVKCLNNEMIIHLCSLLFSMHIYKDIIKKNEDWIIQTLTEAYGQC